MPSLAQSAAVVASTLIAAGLTGAVRRHALRTGVLDVPNARSSHSLPTPRGGGLAIVVATCLTAVYLWLADRSITPMLALAVVAGGGLVAGVGYIDDRAGLGAGVRFGAHLAAAVLAVTFLGARQLGAAVFPVLPDLLTIAMLVVAVVWTLNLFNFMDGIDGIAAAEAAFVAGSAAWLASRGGASAGVTTLMWGATGASLGFLVWNWAPARIFMGDVGSGFLGYLLAVLALASVLEGALSVWTWLILASLFVADATVTLLRRVMRGERWYSAHRSHAYQWLSRRWNSHSRVTSLFGLVNVALVLPLAWWSAAVPARAPGIALATIAVAMVAALACGAGRPETATGAR